MKGIGWDLARKLRGKPWVVFYESFTGDGSTKTFTLDGTVLNATFLSGVWAVANVQITKSVSATKTTGKALYDSSNVFTRHRISSSSVSAVGVVTLNYAPINDEEFYVYYWYELPNGTRLEDYYRDDIVSKFEADEPSIASSISLDTTNFGGILSGADDTVQKAIDTTDDHTHAQLHDRSHSIVSTSDHTSTATSGQMLKGDANGLPVDATNTDTQVSETVTQALNGFVNRTDSTLVMDGSNLTVTTGSSFVFYSEGIKYTKSSTQSVAITNDNTLHFVYFNNAGTLSVSTTTWSFLDNKVLTALVYKTGATYAIFDERHSYNGDRQWHKWAHETVGARYETGLTGTFNDTTLSITQGTIHDEDIAIDTVGTLTTCRLWYRNDGGATMTFDSNVTTPFKIVGGAAKYDSGAATALVSVTNNYYFSSYVYGTPDIDYPIAVVVGQAEYAGNTGGLASVRAEALPTIVAALNVEWKLLYQVIYQNSSGTPAYVEANDKRLVSTGPAGTVQSGSHAALTDRNLANQHPQDSITDLNTTDSPTHVTVKLSGLTDDYIPYHVDDATGLADGPTKTNVDSAVNLKHTQNTDTALGAQSENLDMNTHKVVGVVDPTTDQEAATKKYVDDSGGKKYVAAMMAEGVGSQGGGSTLPTTAEVANAGAVMDTDFDATTFLYATANSTPEAKTPAEVKGILDLEIGTDVLAQQTIGIADDNLLEVDGSPNDDEFARFTAAGLEGRTVAETQSDLGIGGGGNNLLVNSGFWACSQGTLATYGAAIDEDDCSIDGTANWTKNACTLVHDTDHYVMDPTGAGAYAWNATIGTMKQGSLYRMSFDVIDGSSASVSFLLREYGHDGNQLYWSTPRTTTAGYVTHTFLVCHSQTSTNGLPMIYIASDPGGTIFFKNFTFSEVIPQFTGSSGADWHGQTDTLTTERISRDLTHCRGLHGLKITKGANTAEYYTLNSTNVNTFTVLYPYMGQTVTLAAKLYSVTAADNVKLQINDSNGTTESDFISADSLQTISISRTVGTDITYLNFRILFDGDTSDVAYVSQPIAVIGTSISEWSHPANEKIVFESAQVSNYFDGWGSFSSKSAYISPQGDSNGAVGGECSAVMVSTNVNDSGSAGTLTFFAAGLPTYNYENYIYGQVNDIPNQSIGIIDLDYRYEDYLYNLVASGATFDFNAFEYRGIFVK